MRYFSMFSGIGGFELGIKKAWRNKCYCKEKNTQHTEGNKSISEKLQEKEDNNPNCEGIESSENSDRTLLQDGQIQSDSISRNMDKTKENIESRQQMEQASDRILRETDGIRNDEESLRRHRNCSNSREWECIGFSEIDKYAIQIYEKHFPTHKNWGNARDINPKELPDFDLLCGGFPCQAFSIAGKRLGFKDTRGTLFFDIARIVKAKKPRFLFLENVKGLLSHNNRRTFTTILASLDELGYNAEWQVLNSKYFGVPQNRERVFIIGHLRGTSSRQIFPLRKNGKKIGERYSKRIQQITHTIKARDYANWRGNFVDEKSTIKYAKRDKSQHSRVYKVDGISPTLAGASKKSGDCTPKIQVYDDQNKSWLTNPNVINTIQAHSQSRSVFKLAIPVLTPNRPEKRQNGRRFKEDGEEMFTLTGQDQHGIMIQSHSPRSGNPKKGGTGLLESSEHCFTLDGSPHFVNKIRRLTPVECERLQGFPDNWTAEGIEEAGHPIDISDTQRYKCLGNAVTVNVIEAIVTKLTEVVGNV